MPIGNLTSQIFANIYLNELDRYVVHILKPQCYLRYGDDFIVLAYQRAQVEGYRELIQAFLENQLQLQLNPKNDIVVPAGQGIRFLGTYISPQEQRINRRNRKRIQRRLSNRNAASYSGMIKRYGVAADRKEFSWRLLDTISLD